MRIWEWCSDFYNVSYYAEEAKKELSLNPTGPTTSFDPNGANHLGFRLVADSKMGEEILEKDKSAS